MSFLSPLHNWFKVDILLRCSGRWLPYTAMFMVTLTTMYIKYKAQTMCNTRFGSQGMILNGFYTNKIETIKSHEIFPYFWTPSNIFKIKFWYWIYILYFFILFPNLYLIILLFIIYISFVLNSYFHILPPLLGRGSHNKSQKGKCSIFLDFLLWYRGSCQKNLLFYGQTDCKGWPPPPTHTHTPYSQLFVIFFVCVWP